MRLDQNILTYHQYSNYRNFNTNSFLFFGRLHSDLHSIDFRFTNFHSTMECNPSHLPSSSPSPSPHLPPHLPTNKPKTRSSSQVQSNPIPHTLWTPLPSQNPATSPPPPNPAVTIQPPPSHVPTQAKQSKKHTLSPSPQQKVLGVHRNSL